MAAALALNVGGFGGIGAPTRAYSWGSSGRKRFLIFLITRRRRGFRGMDRVLGLSLSREQGKHDGCASPSSICGLVGDRQSFSREGFPFASTTGRRKR